MKKALPIIIGLGLLLVLVAFTTTYTVRFDEVAIKTRFGRTTADSIVEEPGLHFRLPLFAERVAHLDKRLQLIESPLEEISTADSQKVVLRAFLMWQLDTEGEGPLVFRQRFGDSIDGADNQLRDQFRDALRENVGRFTFNELVGSGSRIVEAETAVRDAMARQIAGKGLTPVMVGFSQLLLPARTTTAVMDRMQATSKRQAESERSSGQAEANNIRSEARATTDKILAFANQRAEQIRNEGNQKEEEYLKQMGEAEDFASFLVQLEMLQRALGQYTTLILPANIAPFHLMNLMTPRTAEGIPVPPPEAPPTQSTPPPSQGPATQGPAVPPIKSRGS
jgi:membrane protease subunit HflC